MSVDIIARLKLNAEAFGRRFSEVFDNAGREAEKSGKQVGQNFGSGFRSTLGALVSRDVLFSLGQAGMRAMEYAGNLKTVSAQVGMTTAQLQEYGYAATQVGVSQDALNNGLSELTSKIAEARGGSKSAAEAFAGLGVDVTSAGGAAKGTGDVLSELIGRVSGIADPVARARAEASLFGGQWQAIDPLLRAGSDNINNLRNAAREMGIVLSDRQIQEADIAAKKMAAVKTVLEANIAAAVARNADQIFRLADSLMAAAEGIGNVMATIRGNSRYLNDEGVVGMLMKSSETRRAAGDPVNYVQQRTVALEKATSARRRVEASRAALPEILQFTENGRVKLAREMELKQLGLLQKAMANSEFVDRRFGAARGAVSAPRPASSVFAGTANVPMRGSALGGARAGGGSGRSANDNDAARKLEDAQRLQKTLEETLAREQDLARIEKIRREEGDLAADRAQVRLEMEREYPLLATKTAEQLAAQLGMTQAQAVAQKALYEQVLATRTARIDSADAAEREIAAQEAQLAAAQDFWRARKDRQEADQRDQERAIDDLGARFEDVFRRGTASIWDQFESAGMQALSQLAARQVLSLLNGPSASSGASGASGAAGSAASGLGQLGALGASAAAGLGAFAAASAANQMIGEIVGFKGGPLGVFTGMFSKPKYGTASLTGMPAQITGNSTGGARQGGDAVMQGLDRIAQALDAELGAYSVGIGQFKGKWRVRSEAFNGRLDFKGQSAIGLTDFGKDGGEAAVRAAIADALSDGAIRGISEAAQRILKSGQDLDKALQKAVDIESLPKLLKARLDPLSAAMDEVEKKYQKLAATLKEGGASAEQIAQARELWKLEREDTISQIGQASQGLRDFLSSLKAGANSPFSLRDQRISAEAALDPFRAQIAAGQVIDQAKFAEAAGLRLSIERQIYGSTDAYFEEYRALAALTERAISQIDARTTPPGAGVDPFAEITASSAQKTVEILDQQTSLLIDIRTALAGGNLPAAQWSQYITAMRGFAA